jgi:tRNA1(Val) A37 N6-methylase TrmN6
MTGWQAMPGQAAYTDDSLFDGRIRCLQHRRGYRFSLDAVLLAHFISTRPGEKILDLGCGSGIVSLILAHRNPSCQFTGLELQPALVKLARENVALNNWQGRIRIMEGDLRRIDLLLGAGQFDCLVSNPPYRKKGTGRQNSEAEKLMARHEVTADVASVVRAAAWALKIRGRGAFIYPASRGATLLYELKKQGLEPKRLQAVYSYPASSASLLLVEAVKGGGEELLVLPPFHVYQAPGGEFTAEMAACYRP